MTPSGSSLENTLRKRAQLLQAVIISPRDKSQLTEELGISRSTISRGLDAFERHSCVEKKNGKYRSTTAGKLIFTSYEDYTSTVAHFQKKADIINSLPANTSIYSEFIKGAKKYPADPQIPGIALEVKNEILHSSDRLQGLMSFVLPSYPQELHEAVMNNGLQVELVVEKKLVGSLDCICGEIMRDLKESEDVTLMVTEQKLPYSIWVMESNSLDYGGVTIYENGGVKGVLINYRKEAVEWARNRFNEFQDQATVLS